jgi:hypothetical protein
MGLRLMEVPLSSENALRLRAGSSGIKAPLRERRRGLTLVSSIRPNSAPMRLQMPWRWVLFAAMLWPSEAPSGDRGACWSPQSGRRERARREGAGGNLPVPSRTLFLNARRKLNGTSPSPRRLARAGPTRRAAARSGALECLWEAH